MTESEQIVLELVELVDVEFIALQKREKTLEDVVCATTDSTQKQKL